MNYSQDYTSPHFAPNVKRNLPQWLNGPCRFLEVGVFEARTADWLMTQNSQLEWTGIDNWIAYGKQQNTHRDRAIASLKDRGRLMESDTTTGLLHLHKEGARFDGVYIDGEHTARGMVAESMLAWPLLDVGGVMLWDDIFDGRYPFLTEAIGIMQPMLERLGGVFEFKDTKQIAMRKTNAQKNPPPLER